MSFFENFAISLGLCTKAIMSARSWPVSETLPPSSSSWSTIIAADAVHRVADHADTGFQPMLKGIVTHRANSPNAATIIKATDAMKNFVTIAKDE